MAGKIELLTPSNGKVALVGEDTATDVTVTVPAGDAELVSTDTLRTELNATGSAPIYACRAWVNFNGTGTVAIRASGNVSSITDNGTGLYTINFTTAMPDADYSVSGLTGTDTTDTPIRLVSGAYLSGSIGIRTQAISGTPEDRSFVVLQVVR